MTYKKTDPEISQIILEAIRCWAERRIIRIRITRRDLIQAFKAQTKLGWYNLFLGIGVKQWADCQQRYYERLGKRNTGKRWLIELQKKFINTSWDIWMSRCATRWLPGNYREQQAVIALDEAILEEFSKGLDDDFPPRSAYLLEDYTLEEVLRSTIVRKKFGYNRLRPPGRIVSRCTKTDLLLLTLACAVTFINGWQGRRSSGYR